MALSLCQAYHISYYSYNMYTFHIYTKYFFVFQDVGHFGPCDTYNIVLIERDYPGITVSTPHKMIGAKGADVCEVDIILYS